MYMKVNIDGFQCKTVSPIKFANSLRMNKNLQILSSSLVFLPGTADFFFFFALTYSPVTNLSKTAEKNY